MGRVEVQRWRIERNISVGHLLSTLVLIGSMVGWAVVIEGRIAKLESRVEQSGAAVGDLRSDGREHLQEMLDRMDRLDDKMDRHLHSHATENGW